MSPQLARAKSSTGSIRPSFIMASVWHGIPKGAIGDAQNVEHHKEPAVLEHTANLSVGSGLVTDIHADMNHVSPIE